MRKRFIDILSNTAGISEDTLHEAELISSENRIRLDEVLIQNKFITETQLLETYSIQYSIPFWPDLPIGQLGNDFTQVVPIQYLKNYTMVPIEWDGQNKDIGRVLGESENDAGEGGLFNNGYVIAINDPSCFQQLDDLAKMLGLDHYRVVFSTKDTIISCINMSYDLRRDSAEQLVQDMEENGQGIINQLEDTADLLDDASDAPIIRLVNHIISQSTKARASDIHIEPYQRSFKVRYRVDGILYDLLSPPKWILPALVSRIKVMANMNIAEKRLPQDGRFEVRIGDQNIDVRTSTIPTSFGERAVLRLLIKSGKLLTLPELGLLPEKLDLLRELVASPNGIILVTGPTGSGKTTSLYAVLSAINTPDINIITIEDPIEYQIDGISQIQVNPKIDLTFARGLRSIVRQDPDVLLIGEIRDRETADIAVQSALTGHLVFSTLHTNDSASAITRLVDIGVEPFLISSSVIAVVAQRLIRVLCATCKEPYSPEASTLNHIGLSPDKLNETAIYKAVGCDQCFQTGYRGRIGIFEIMLLNEELKTLILQTFDSNRIKNKALQQGMVTLRQDGIEKVLSGTTTIEEVLRITEN